MSKMICDKCNGPISIENGYYTCVLCGATYGEANEIEKTPENFENWYTSTFLEKKMQIANKISRRIDGGDVYVIAALSNGQYYTNFTAQNGYHSVYRGQCDVENWEGVEHVITKDEFSIGITEDGKVQTTLIEVEDYLESINKKMGKDFKWKEILDLTYEDTYTSRYGTSYETRTLEERFFGLNSEGEVVIDNPFKLFEYKKEDSENINRCANLIKEYKKWPKIRKMCGHSVAIGEDNKIYCAIDPEHYMFKDDVEQYKNVSELKNVADCINTTIDLYHKIFVTLTTDGDVIITSEAGNKGVVDSKKVVQIAADDDYLFRLFEDGTLIRNRLSSEGILEDEKIIDTDVVSINTEFHVKGDGTVYKNSTKAIQIKTIQIKDLKMFESIYTLEEEWNNTKTNIENSKKALEDDIKEKKIQLNSIKEQKQEIDKKIESLGFFSKEKKELRAQTKEKESLINKLVEELDGLESELSNEGAHKAAWHHFELPSSKVTLEEIMALQQAAFAPKAKSASIVKSAAIGGVIAGPTGAIVGAIYAADKNRRK